MGWGPAALGRGTKTERAHRQCAAHFGAEVARLLEGVLQLALQRLQRGLSRRRHLLLGLADPRHPQGRQGRWGRGGATPGGLPPTELASEFWRRSPRFSKPAPRPPPAPTEVGRIPSENRGAPGARAGGEASCAPQSGAIWSNRIGRIAAAGDSRSKIKRISGKCVDYTVPRYLGTSRGT